LRTLSKKWSEAQKRSIWPIVWGKMGSILVQIRTRTVYVVCKKCGQNSGVFRGGPRCDAPPFWPDHENFLQATLYEGQC